MLLFLDRIRCATNLVCWVADPLSDLIDLPKSFRRDLALPMVTEECRRPESQKNHHGEHRKQPEQQLSSRPDLVRSGNPFWGKRPRIQYSQCIPESELSVFD